MIQCAKVTAIRKEERRQDELAVLVEAVVIQLEVAEANDSEETADRHADIHRQDEAAGQRPRPKATC